MSVNIEVIEARAKSLMSRRNSVQKDVDRLSAVRDEKRRNLKETLTSCTDAGFNPSTLAADIDHMSQVIMTKMDVCEADLDASEKIIRPMLCEIEKV